MTGANPLSPSAPETVIRVGQDVTTLINVFSVRPEDQAKLVALLDRATEEVMRHRAGFVSANIHASLDGTRVVNYAQWRSVADFQAMLKDPEAAEHMQATQEIATAEPQMYALHSVHHA